MEMTFRSVQESFDALKKRFQSGEISRQDFIDEMKKLRLKDDQGRFWMIGAQSGKWYYFDGKDWLQSEPPSQNDNKSICVFCGFENDLEAETCARCGGTKGDDSSVCPTCGGQLQKPFLTCPNCQKGPESPVQAVESIRLEEEPQSGILVLRGIPPVSALFFGGLLGAFLGILIGALAGATGAFSENLAFLPAALFDQQGKLLGSIFFGLLGGAAGFILSGLFWFLLAVLVNFILSLIGGLKFNTGEKPAPKPRKSDDGADGGLGFNLRD